MLISVLMKKCALGAVQRRKMKVGFRVMIGSKIFFSLPDAGDDRQ